MIYEWRCRNCSQTIDVFRDIDRRHIPPMDEEYGPETEECGGLHSYTRSFNSSVPFQTLSDRGVFMDEHGNYPPRKID